MPQLQFNRWIPRLAMLAALVASPLSHAQTQFQPPMVGNKLDQNGCNPSTGASWCAKEKACVQPWVLAPQKGLPKGDKAAFDAYCKAPAPAAPAPAAMPMVGSKRDAHGCMPSAGYAWCAKEKACVQPWVLAPQKGFAKGDKAAFDAYCVASAK